MSIKQENIKVEMAVDDDEPRTSRGKHSTPAVEGREAKRISQSNTAFPTNTHILLPSRPRRQATGVIGQVSTT